MAGLKPIVTLEPIVPSLAQRANVNIPSENNAGSGAIIGTSSLQGLQTTENPEWITLYRMPTKDNPNRCLVHLAPHRYGAQGYQAISELRININAPKVRNYPISKRKNIDNTSVAKKTTQASKSSSMLANTSRYIVIDKGQDLHEVNIPVSAEVAFVSKAWASTYEIFRTEPHLFIDTLVNTVEYFELGPSEEIAVSQVNYDRLGPSGKILKSKFSNVFRKSVNITSSSVQFVTTSFGSLIHAKGSTVSHYDHVRVWYRKSGSGTQYKLLGDVSSGESLEVPLHGKYDFATVFFKMGIPLLVNDRWYRQDNGVECYFNPSIATLKLIQTGIDTYFPIYDMSKIESALWDYFIVSTEIGDFKYYRSAVDEWENSTVGKYEEQARVNFYRVVGTQSILVDTIDLRLKKNVDFEINNHLSLGLVNTDQDGNINIGLTLSANTDEPKWVVLDQTNPVSAENQTWKQMVNQKRWVPYVSVIEHYGSLSREIAYINCSVLSSVNQNDDLSILDHKKLKSHSVSEDNGNYSISLTLERSLRKNSVIEIRAHKYTAGIDHVYRQKQDHRVQRDLASSKGARIKKSESIWFTEHPATLNANKEIPEKFSNLDRMFSSGPNSILFPVEEDMVRPTSSNPELTIGTSTIYRVSNDGKNVHFIDFLRVTGVPLASGVIMQLMVHNYQIGSFLSDAGIDVWIPVDKAMESFNSEGIPVYTVTVNNSKFEIPASDFAKQRIFER